VSDKVIIFVADEAYCPHYRALAVNCRNEGQYEGDFLWIVPDDADDWAKDLERRGFRVLSVSDRGFLAKFQIFNPYLRNWEQAMYLDADVIVQRPLQSLFDQLTAWPREADAASFGAFHRKRIIACREEVPVFMGWQIWDKEWKDHTAIYEDMSKRFPHVLTADKMWNTAILLYEPVSIPNDTIERLRLYQNEFAICNDPTKGGTDEPIIDLLMHNQMAQVGEKGWCYWGLDEHNARVPSISRGWLGEEIPVILHYTRWYSAWINKPPDTDAYMQHRLGRPCHDIYLDNLAAFENTFPAK